MSVNNPFFEISLLPYQAPRFDAINDSHIARRLMKQCA